MKRAKKKGILLIIFAVHLIGWGAFWGLDVLALNHDEIIWKILGYVLSFAVALSVGYIIARLLHNTSKSKKTFLIGNLTLFVGFVCIVSIPILNVHGSIIDTALWLLDGGMADYNAPFLLVLSGFYLYQILYYLITEIAFVLISMFYFH